MYFWCTKMQITVDVIEADGAVVGGLTVLLMGRTASFSTLPAQQLNHQPFCYWPNALNR
jgi:hypothetical protein